MWKLGIGFILILGVLVSQFENSEGAEMLGYNLSQLVLFASGVSLFIAGFKKYFNK